MNPRPAFRSAPGNLRSRLALLGTGILTALFSLARSARADNLDHQATPIVLGKKTMDQMEARARLNPSLLPAEDSAGLILMSTHGPGAAAGTGSYMTFYNPPSTEVAENDWPTTLAAFTAISRKGPSILMTGDDFGSHLFPQSYRTNA